MSADAEGRETTLVTLEDFAAWMLKELYGPGIHRSEVETRFVREQIRHVANAAIQQAAQHVLRKFPVSGRMIAQEILSVRTKEKKSETYGENPASAEVKDFMVIPVKDYDGDSELGISPEGDPEGI